MVNYSQDNLDATFSALAHPARRAILRQLAQRRTSVQDLARPLKLSLPAIAKHIAVLEHSALITTEKRGRVRECRLSVEPLQNANEWLEFYRQFWESRLDGLESYLKGPATKP